MRQTIALLQEKASHGHDMPWSILIGELFIKGHDTAAFNKIMAES
jgi:hypothetical protein